MIAQRMMRGLRRFRVKEDGMVTVEWLALAAAVTIGAVGVSWTIYTQIKTAAPGTAIATNINTVAGQTTSVAAP